MSERDVERVARALCRHAGRDPDFLHPQSYPEPMLDWKWFEGPARAALDAALSPELRALINELPDGVTREGDKISVNLATIEALEAFARSLKEAGHE